MSGRGLAIIVVLVVAAGLFHGGDTLAQSGSPFGVGRPDSPGTAPTTGVGVWLAAQQAAFYKGLVEGLRQARAAGTIGPTLILLSLGYGVLHAAGPGHGKAVISSYLLATGETLRRGAILSFAAAALQGLTAIVLVGVLALILGATARRMDEAALWLERIAYFTMAAIGAWLAWRKARAVWGIFARRYGWPGRLAAHDPDCNHMIAPPPLRSRRAALAAIVSVGIRPCTGAIIVLVFALSQGILLAGIAGVALMSLGTAITVVVIASLAVFAKSLAVRVAAPGTFAGGVTIRLLELAAALVIVAIGLTLFFMPLGPGG